MIIGIDPASKKIAMVGDKSGVPFVHVKQVPKTNRAVELSDIRAYLSQFLTLTAADEEIVLFCEAPILAGARNLQSTIQIAESVGMILALGYPCYLVAPSAWKQRTVGKGSAKKEEVASWLAENHPKLSEMCDGDQDLCDAAAIYLYGLEMDAYQRSITK